MNSKEGEIRGSQFIEAIVWLEKNYTLLEALLVDKFMDYHDIGELEKEDQVREILAELNALMGDINEQTS